MSRIVPVALSLVLIGCASQSSWWDGRTEWDNEDIVTIKGWLHTSPNGGVFLCDGVLVGNASAADCLDVVFAQGEGSEGSLPQVVTVRGAFHRYSDDFVGLGNLRSEVGLLEESEIVGEKDLGLSE